MIRPFTRKAPKLLLTTAIFRITEEERVHPTSGQVGRFVTLESPDCINVVALTAARELILVRQWRHGTLAEELELPAGLIDAGETPLQAAARELREETGYVASQLRVIGASRPNPAYQPNTCYTVLADGCAEQGTQDPDPLEEIEVDRVACSQVHGLFQSGRIRSSLMLTSLLHWLEDERRIGWPGL